MPPTLRLATEPRSAVLDLRPQRAPEPGLVGRAAELEHLITLVAPPAALVALVGPPGVGKSALARELISRLSASRPVTLCHFEGVVDLDGFCATTASALSIKLRAGDGLDAALRTLGDALGSLERRLLVLDGLDHLDPSVGPALRALLQGGHPVTAVLCARRPLQLPGERLLSLRPMSTAATSAPEGTEAAAFFVHCVRKQRESYHPEPDELASIGELTRRLGGLPLAIELVASQQRALDARSLLAQLPKTLRRIVRDAEPLERSLREALAWSTGALSPAELAMLRHCALFHAGFTLDAVDALGAHDDPPVTSARRVEALLARSLLRPLEPGRADDAPRFTLDESTRAFLIEGMRDDGTLAPHRVHHARVLAASASAHPGRLLDARHLGPLLPRRDDVLAAVEALVEQPDAGDILAPLIATLDLITADARISAREQEAFAAVLARPAGDPPWLTAHAVRASVRGMLRQGRSAEAEGVVKAAMATAAMRAAVGLHAAMLECEGDVMLMSWRIPEAIATLQRAADLARRHNDPLHAARIAWLCAMTMASSGRLHEATVLLQEAATECGLQGDLRTLARIDASLGSIALEEGRLDAARAHYGRTVSLARKAMVPRLATIVTGYRGIVELAAGRAELALSLLDEANHAARGQSHERGAGIFLAASAAAAVGVHGFEDAVRRLGEARAAIGADPALAAVVALYSAHIDLSESRRMFDLGDHEGARARWQGVLRRIEQTRVAVLPPPPGAPSPLRLLDASDDARIALKILEQALGPFGALFQDPEATAERARDSRPLRKLAIAHGAAWFSLDGEAVQLGGRPVLRKLLWALCQHTVARPTEVVPAETLIAAAWGDQRLGPKVGASRLYVALGDLRRLGLRDVLRSDRGGYALDARVEVIFR